MNCGCGQARNVGQQVILGVVSKVVRLSHGQVWTDRYISFSAKSVPNPADLEVSNAINAVDGANSAAGLINSKGQALTKDEERRTSFPWCQHPSEYDGLMRASLYAPEAQKAMRVAQPFYLSRNG
jgi:hypothetical protein